MIARLLRAELSGENPRIEERGETHDDSTLALGLLVSQQLSVRSRKKRMDKRLAVAFEAAGEGLGPEF
jgi:hypothetical protein